MKSIKFIILLYQIAIGQNKYNDLGNEIDTLFFQLGKEYKSIKFGFFELGATRNYAMFLLK